MPQVRAALFVAITWEATPSAPLVFRLWFLLFSDTAHYLWNHSMAIRPLPPRYRVALPRAKTRTPEFSAAMSNPQDGFPETELAINRDSVRSQSSFALGSGL